MITYKDKFILRTLMLICKVVVHLADRKSFDKEYDSIQLDYAECVIQGRLDASIPEYSKS